MAMPELNPTWRIEREPASLVFLVLADAIRLDPQLGGRGKVKTWIIDGQLELLGPDRLGQFLDPKFAITADWCPAIALYPEVRDGERRDEANQQATLSVTCQIYMPGINRLDALDYWGRVQRAVLSRNFPGTDERLEVRLHRAGGTGERVRIDQPAISRPVTDAAGALVHVAEGSFSTTYRIPEGED